MLGMAEFVAEWRTAMALDGPMTTDVYMAGSLCDMSFDCFFLFAVTVRFRVSSLIIATFTASLIKARFRPFCLICRFAVVSPRTGANHCSIAALIVDVSSTSPTSPPLAVGA